MKSQEIYLEEILECIRKIKAYTISGHETFTESSMTQDAVIRNFEIIGEIVKRLNPALLESQPEVQWRRIASFRDVLIHDYAEIRIETVWNIIEEDLALLRKGRQINVIESEEQLGNKAIPWLSDSDLTITIQPPDFID